MRHVRALAFVLLLVAPGACWYTGLVARQQAAAAMAGAASAWLEALSPELRARATFATDSPEWVDWHYVPVSMTSRPGVSIDDMTPAQHDLALTLLQTGLSARGYATTTGVIDLENVLRELEGTAMRNPGQYLFSVYGEPGPAAPWGWRIEGHHVSLRFLVAASGLAIASAPAFLGANPATVPSGPQQRRRVLGAREDAARALLESLTDEQREVAVLTDTAPRDIATRTAVVVDPQRPDGLTAARMTDGQRALLRALIEVYTGVMTDEVASGLLERIEAAGFNDVAFAWSGPIVRGERHYYRVQGPTFLIEYDNSQNDGNHIHSVWRDFDGDFGRDLLAEHLASVAH